MAADAHLVRAIRGPITLITLGVLFTFDHFTPYGFNQTWPVLLIVFGLLSLLRRSVSHPMAAPPPGGQPWGAPPPGPMGGYPAGGYPTSSGSSYTGSGGYRQSSYGNTSQGSANTPPGSTGGSQ